MAKAGRKPGPYKRKGKMPKHVIIPGDPDNAWARDVASQISNYLRRDYRDHKVQLNLNETEMGMVEEAAALQGVPVATILRGCAIWGIAVFLQAMAPVEKE